MKMEAIRAFSRPYQAKNLVLLNIVVFSLLRKILLKIFFKDELWTQVYVGVNAPESFHIEIKAATGGKSDSMIALDDIVLYPIEFCQGKILNVQFIKR